MPRACWLAVCLVALQLPSLHPFSILDVSHYLDYLPYRQEGLVAFEDFRTAPYPPLHLRNRKMDTGAVKLSVEEVCELNVWPANWPFGPEDFRPMDYGRDEVINTLPQYQFSQSLIESDQATLIPGFLRVPIRRHFILPKDKVALAEHLRPIIKPGATVLELFSTYDSILPPVQLGPTVGVGWSPLEMKANAALDDWIEQDISVDPYLPLADNFFDVVVMPANFQLLQRPREMFEEINRCPPRSSFPTSQSRMHGRLRLTYLTVTLSLSLCISLLHLLVAQGPETRWHGRRGSQACDVELLGLEARPLLRRDQLPRGRACSQQLLSLRRRLQPGQELRPDAARGVARRQGQGRALPAAQAGLLRLRAGAQAQGLAARRWRAQGGREPSQCRGLSICTEDPEEHRNGGGEARALLLSTLSGHV